MVVECMVVDRSHPETVFLKAVHSLAVGVQLCRPISESEDTRPVNALRDH